MSRACQASGSGPLEHLWLSLVGIPTPSNMLTTSLTEVSPIGLLSSDLARHREFASYDNHDDKSTLGIVNQYFNL